MWPSASDTPLSNWRGWLARSPGAQTTGRLIAFAAAVCATGAVVIGLTALIRDKPLSGIAILLVPAIPTLALGQLWAIAVISARLPRSSGGFRDRLRTRQTSGRSTQTFFFGDLPSRFARPLLVLAVLGWLSAMTAFPALAKGGPAASGEGCRYRLVSHGSYTCVSRHTYEHAGAGEQRFASGIMLAFFAIHTGAALGGLNRRRRP